MQHPYHIKASLQEYYKLIRSGKWEIPDFSQKCLICCGQDCAKYLGCYERGAILPEVDFHVDDLPVMRFLCHDKGPKKNCNHITFSLLPLDLVPYKQLPIHFMVLATWIRLKNKLGQVNALAVIEKELVNYRDFAFFINTAAQLEWAKIVNAALGLILTSKISILNKAELESIRCNIDNEKGLLTFLEAAIAYESRYADPVIRGPDALGWDFYQLQGGADKLAPFLFGVASQHRF